jgi:hypothetical protein
MKPYASEDDRSQGCAQKAETLRASQKAKMHVRRIEEYFALGEVIRT